MLHEDRTGFRPDKRVDLSGLKRGNTVGAAV